MRKVKEKMAPRSSCFGLQQLVFAERHISLPILLLNAALNNGDDNFISVTDT